VVQAGLSANGRMKSALYLALPKRYPRQVLHRLVGAKSYSLNIDDLRCSSIKRTIYNDKHHSRSFFVFATPVIPPPPNTPRIISLRAFRFLPDLTIRKKQRNKNYPEPVQYRLYNSGQLH
jgi:hypothetical protein